MRRPLGEMTDIEDGLPANVILLSTFKVEYGKERHCECYRHSYPKKSPGYVLDYQNREITCKHCGNVVDPIDAFEILATEQENWQREIDQLHEQAKQLRAYKPWLKAIKFLEQMVRRGTMVPVCPCCDNGIFIEDLTHFRSRDREIERRKFKKDGGND